MILELYFVLVSLSNVDNNKFLHMNNLAMKIKVYTYKAVILKNEIKAFNTLCCYNISTVTNVNII